jgi:hypothetical protein
VPSPPPTVEPPSNIAPTDPSVPVADPAATAQAAIDEANAHPTVTNQGVPSLAGAPMSAETRAWLEANGSRVWVVADPA